MDYTKIRQSRFFQQHFHLLYEDADLLALDKPAKIAVHPGGPGQPERTMIALARAYMLAKPGEISLAHRLDQETSGVLLFAKHQAALERMDAIMRARQIDKLYLALVKGQIKPDQGVIKSRLTLVDGDKGNAHVIVARRPGEGKTAITHFTVKQRFGAFATLLRVKTETGRMHQIRVHLQMQRHPVWGDGRYGDFEFNKQIAKAPYSLKRQFLHAAAITLPHPMRQEKLTITAALPADLAHVLAVLLEKAW